MGRKKQQAMRAVHRNAAGIDVGKSSHYVAVDGAAAARSARRLGRFLGLLLFAGKWNSG